VDSGNRFPVAGFIFSEFYQVKSSKYKEKVVRLGESHFQPDKKNSDPDEFLTGFNFSSIVKTIFLIFGCQISNFIFIAKLL